MGHSIPSLRRIRAASIGTEAARLNTKRAEEISTALNRLRKFNDLPARQQNIVQKYALDSSAFLTEMQRVIKPGGQLSLVLGESNLRGKLIENSKLFSHLARNHGFTKTSQHRRPLQENRRYLPVTSKDNSLENRMRYEVIQTYVSAV
jgi:hypothetical protein